MAQLIQTAAEIQAGITKALNIRWIDVYFVAEEALISDVTPGPLNTFDNISVIKGNGIGYYRLTGLDADVVITSWIQPFLDGNNAGLLVMNKNPGDTFADVLALYNQAPWDIEGATIRITLAA